MNRAPFSLTMVAALFTATVCGRLDAQNVYFSNTADTIFTVSVGRSNTLPLFVGTNCGSGIASYSITVFFDAPRVSVTAVDTVPGYTSPAPTLDTSVPGQATISASGGTVNYCPMGLAEVTFTLADTASTGSLVSMRVNSLTDLSSTDLTATHTTDLLDLWQAKRVWGDIDSTFTVTSRDALIALTAAVGLPTTCPACDVSAGDVDVDGQVTSRDALFILSYAVGLTYGYGRANVPIPNHAPPLYPAPNDFAFFRGNALDAVFAGDTTVTPVAASPNFYPSYGLRWSPNGAKVLATMYTSANYYEVVAVDVTTGTIDSGLTVNPNFESSGVVSPDGSRIAFISARVSPYAVFTMPFSDSAAATSVTANAPANFNVSTGGSGYSNLDWDSLPGSPGFGYIVFPADTTSGNWGLYAVNPDSFAAKPVAEVFPNSQQKIVRFPVWNTRGDSVLFRSDSAGGNLYEVTAPVGTTPVIATHLYGYGGFDWPAWTSAGIWYRRYNSSPPYGYDYFLQQPNGRVLRVLHGGSSDQGMGVRR